MGKRLSKISDEAKAVAAASLVQSHATILAGVYAGRKQGSPVHVQPHELVEKLYAHFLKVVESEGSPVPASKDIEI